MICSRVRREGRSAWEREWAICFRERWRAEIYAREWESGVLVRTWNGALSNWEWKNEVLYFLSWLIRCDSSIEKEHRVIRCKESNQRLTHGLLGLWLGFTGSSRLGFSIVGAGSEERHVQGFVTASLIQLFDQAREQSGRGRSVRSSVD